MKIRTVCGDIAPEELGFTIPYTGADAEQCNGRTV